MSFNSNTPIFFGGISGVTATRGSKDPELGTRVNFEGNEYLYIYNGADSDIVPGKIASPLAATTSFTGTVSSVASYGLPFGVVKHTTLTTNTYGWVLTRGYAPAYTSLAIAAGIGLEPVANGTLGTAVTGVCYGVLLSATSAVTNITGGAYFRF